MTNFPSVSFSSYCGSLFPRIVVWQEKTLSFQTSSSLISNVQWLPPGCLSHRWPRGCFCWSVYWFVGLFLAAAFSVLAHLGWKKRKEKKRSLKFLQCLSSSLSQVPPDPQLPFGPLAILSLTPPPILYSFLPVGAVRDSSSLRSGNETSKQWLVPEPE